MSFKQFIHKIGVVNIGLVYNLMMFYGQILIASFLKFCDRNNDITVQDKKMTFYTVFIVIFGILSACRHYYQIKKRKQRQLKKRCKKILINNK